MPTVASVDINKLLYEIKKLTSANRRLESLAALGIAGAVALYLEVRRKDEKIRTLRDEIAELKKVEGE